jgi:hypothetical protein
LAIRWHPFALRPQYDPSPFRFQGSYVEKAWKRISAMAEPEGITYSRHPSYSPQFIPTFTLWYIGMLHDYSRYGSDAAFVKNKVSGTREILGYFKNYQQPDGSVAIPDVLQPYMGKKVISKI